MKRLLLLTAGLALIVWTPNLQAGTIDDAKAAIAQKQYDKVDGILEKELSAASPSAEALQVSLDAALAGGRVLTAHKRVGALLKATDSKDPELIYRSAEIAEQVGDSRTALVRYLGYARAVNDKTPKLRQALEYVLKRENFPDEFKKYVGLFGATDGAFTLGKDLLQRLLDIPDADKALEVGEFLLVSFPKGENVNVVHEMLHTAADGLVFGKEPKDRYVRPLRVMIKGTPVTFVHIDVMFGSADAGLTDEQRVKIVTEYMKSSKTPVSIGVLTRFGSARNLLTDEAKLQAGKDYLSVEAVYRDAKDPQAYLPYLQYIEESPQVFAIKGKELLPAAEIQSRINLLRARFPNDPRVQGHVTSFLAMVPATDAPARTAFLRANLPVLAAPQVLELLALTKGENLDAVLAEASKGRTFGEALDLRVALINWANDTKNKALLLSTAQAYMTGYPGTFGWQHMRNNLVNSTIADANEKLAIVQDVIVKAGFSVPMKALLDDMSKEKAWADNPKFVEVRNGFEARKPGSDIAMRTLAALGTIPANPAAPPATVAQTVKAFLDEYKGPMPAGDDKIDGINQFLLLQVLWQHRNHVAANWPALAQWIEMWAPRLPLGSAIDTVIATAYNGQNWALLYKLAPIYVALTTGADKGSPKTWTLLSTATNPKDDFKSVFAGAYGSMPADLAASYLYNQRIAFDPKKQLLIDELAKLLATPGATMTDTAMVKALISLLASWQGVGCKVPATLSKTLWDAYLADADKTGRYDFTAETGMYTIYAKTGVKKDGLDFLQGYLETIKRRPVVQQIDAVQAFLRGQVIPVEEQVTTQPDGPKVDTITQGYRRYMMYKVLKPMLEQVPPQDWNQVTVAAGVIGDASVLLSHPQAEMRQYGLDMSVLLVKLCLGGMGCDAAGAAWYPIMDLQCKQAIAAGDLNQFNRLASFYAQAMLGEPNWEGCFITQVGPLVKSLEDLKAYEPIFVFMTAIEKKARPNEAGTKLLLVAKSKAAAFLPEMIAVPPTDPAYNLHLAVQALTLGNEARAWELTSTKLKLLTEGWDTLDPQYVAWSIDQMRKQKMLKEALDFSFKVLLREQTLEPSVAAKVLLIKGDIYRDMENYQASRIEYEGLKNNPRYNKTEPGAKGLWRLISLYILTKNYTAAEGLLERLIDDSNLQVQAEAYYLLAKMSYDKGEFKDSMEYVRKVKQRVINHVEATLLEGELNLRLPGGLANVEVELGDPKLSTFVIPGRPLELKLQDQNLSIARAGQTVPVILSTSKGGDVEHVKLVPSASSKNLFTGRVNTGLGKVAKDNLTLELRGDDVVSYQIDPEFQKANRLNYPAKTLEVRYDARLSASSGEILSLEEQERRDLENQLHRRQQSRKFDILRDGRTIRPGSSIYVQVVDLAGDQTDELDKVKVDLKTASGDTLEGFMLTETGPHTGIFRGAVPTGIPLPKAAASDTEEGKNPASMINLSRAADWASQADGKKPKWVEVDTMTSCEVASVVLQIPHLDQLKEATVQGCLSDEFEDIASYPARTEAAKGGMLIDMAADQNGNAPDQIRKYLKLAATSSYNQDSTVFDRNDTPLKGKDGWMTNRIKGAFYLDANRTLELKFIGPYSPNDWQSAYLFIDGQLVLNCPAVNEAAAKVTGKVDLPKGVHTMEILLRDNWSQSKLTVGCRKDDGTFETLPAGLFSIKDHKQLAEALKPKATIAAEGDTLTAKLTVPKRLRKVRVVFKDFTGPGIGVKQFAVTDAPGNIVVPCKEDFTKGLTNKTLEIAPGDEITVTYRDEKRVDPEGKMLASNLNSSFYNGSITLAEEQVITNPANPTDRRIDYVPAKRCRVGDQLAIILTDYDEDTTDQRDTVGVKVTTSSGQTLLLKALETAPPTDPQSANHSGQFMAILKIGKQAAKDTIRLDLGDTLTVRYLDKENTDPGVPMERSYGITEAGRSSPEMMVYRTSVTMVPDTSPEARARVKHLGKDSSVVLYRPQIVARHPEFQAAPAPATAPSASSTEIIASVSAPILFEVTYPKMALNLSSTLTATAVAQSELTLASKENRKPVELSVPMYIRNVEGLAASKGYPILLQSHLRRDEEAMLRDGSFSGVIRLQIGTHGDPINDMVLGGEGEFAAPTQTQGETYRVPTLLVSGNDTVLLRIKDQDTGKQVQCRIRLLSDARLDLLDRSYTVRNDAIHLGERFYVRVIDPDQDTTDARDAVQVKVRCSSGASATLTLTETLTHSGIFTGSIAPAFAGEKATSAASRSEEKSLRVNFGDTVAFEYVDAQSVSSSSAVTLSQAGKIFHGSNGEVVAFTKRFKDPEIAVKTRFLIAESLFAMGQEHRKLNQKEKADEEIARGKRILEEALRDYPDTTQAVQGEYLLANLAQALGNMSEAIGRYSHVIATWPESEYASESQFNKALCFEKQSDYDQACEEYVKLTYIFPESPRVAEATVRLANYYYRKQSYKVAGKIFFNFQQRNSSHKLAPEALFMSAQSYYKLGDFKEAAKLWGKLVDAYPDNKDIRAESMFWVGDAQFKGQDYVRAYQAFKKLTWDYPESKWAKMARGRLTEEVFSGITDSDDVREKDNRR